MKNHFCFFQTAETGNRTPNSSVNGSGAYHYTRAPAPQKIVACRVTQMTDLALVFFKGHSQHIRDIEPMLA